MYVFHQIGIEINKFLTQNISVFLHVTNIYSTLFLNKFDDFISSFWNISINKK